MARTAKNPNVIVSERIPHSGTNEDRRLLALEVRPQRVGFVVIEGASKLLDWGVRTYGGPRDHRVLAGEKLRTLMALYSPTVIVVRQRDRLPPRVAEATNEIVTRVRSEAQQESVPLQCISSQAVRSFFAQYECRTKHEIAATLAEWFEELAWKLPPKRKIWQSEHYNMLTFDAAATAMAFLGRHEYFVERHDGTIYPGSSQN